jgi:hypothetical protein
MRALTEEQVSFFKKNGYLVVKNLFSEEEINGFREGCKRNQPGDSVCRPEFKNSMLLPKVLNIIKDLIGEDIIYPGLSLTRTEDKPKPFGSRFFHSDLIGIEDGDFKSDCPIINTGVYLQDQTNYSGALKVIPGSHTRPCVTSKTVYEACKNIVKYLLKGDLRTAWSILNLHRSVNIASMPGDLIMWYARMHHSGYGIRPRLFPNWSLPPVFENWVPSFLRLPDNPRREVMLSIYAAPSKYLEPYLKNQIRKGYRRTHYLNNACLEEKEVQELAKKNSVTIRNDGYHYAQTHAASASAEGTY